MYEVECFCGKLFKAEGNDILSNKIRSCGCRRNKKQIAKMLEDPTKSLKKSLYVDYKNKAPKRNIEFSLTEEEFYALIKEPCHYCGEVGSNIKRTKRTNSDATYSYNGIDRVNNEIGYEVGNVVPCCRFCNQSKHTHEVSVFVSKIVDIAKHLIKTGQYKGSLSE